MQESKVEEEKHKINMKTLDKEKNNSMPLKKIKRVEREYCLNLKKKYKSNENALYRYEFGNIIKIITKTEFEKCVTMK